MASTPPTDQAFLREVDEAVRQDNLRSLWQRYGRIAIGLIGLGLLAFAGYLYWQQHRQQKSGEVAEVADKMLQTVSTGGVADPKALASVEDAGRPGYRAIALLTKAAEASRKGDIKGAAAQYGTIAADSTLAQSYRDLALVRQVALSFDQMSPQQVIDRLKPLAVSGEPWFGSAGEMTAIAYMKMRRPGEAGATFAALVKDQGVPASIKSRARQMAGLLGVDAVGDLAGMNDNREEEAANATARK